MKCNKNPIKRPNPDRFTDEFEQTSRKHVQPILLLLEKKEEKERGREGEKKKRRNKEK